MDVPKGWIGVDFDGTIAYQIKRTDPYQLGPPIPRMVERVCGWLKDGYRVKIMTARMAAYSHTLGQYRDLNKMERMLRDWCKEHLGQELEITNQKDGEMLALWDDKAIGVVADSGLPLTAFEATSNCPICGINFPHQHTAQG